MSASLRAPVWPAAAPVLPALGVALAALAALFGAEIASAVHVWNGSTAYGHCWLVVPIVLWLMHERRFQAAAIAAAPAWWPALLALPLALLWIAADLLGVMEGRQFALIGFVELALLAALGPRQWWSLSAAFLYLVFLVPFGAFLTPVLQDFTADFVRHGLDLLGVPNRVTQFQIEIPEGNFYVAEACAGLRFLIASIAFGALYAVTLFRSPWRRAAFIAVACVVPVIANGFRGLGIVLLGHVLGSAEAAATDHLLYGWVFFSLVIVALAAAGMPFRQDPPPARAAAAAPAPGTGRRAVLAVVPVLAVAGLGPAIALALDARAVPASGPVQVLVTPQDCALTSVAADAATTLQTYHCGDETLAARTEILPLRANPTVAVRAGADWAGAMVPGHDVDNRMLAVGEGRPVTWHMLLDEDSPRAAAALLFIDGQPALGGLRDRIRLAGDMLNGTGMAPVAIAVAITGGDADPVETLRHFLAAQSGLAARVAVAARARR
jgi:exosortase A